MKRPADELINYLRKVIANGQWPKSLRLLQSATNDSRVLLGAPCHSSPYSPQHETEILSELRERLLLDFLSRSWFAGLAVLSHAVQTAKVDHHSGRSTVFERPYLPRVVADTFLFYFRDITTSSLFRLEQRDRMAAAAQMAAHSASNEAVAAAFPVIALGKWGPALSIFHRLRWDRKSDAAVPHALMCLARHSSGMGRAHDAIAHLRTYYMSWVAHKNMQEKLKRNGNYLSTIAELKAATTGNHQKIALLSKTPAVLPNHLSWLKPYTSQPLVGAAVCRSSSWPDALAIAGLFYNRYTQQRVLPDGEVTQPLDHQQQQRHPDLDILLLSAVQRCRGKGLWQQGLRVVSATGGLCSQQMALAVLGMMRDARLETNHPVRFKVGECLMESLGVNYNEWDEKLLAGLVRMLPWKRLVTDVLGNVATDRLPFVAVTDTLISQGRWCEAAAVFQLLCEHSNSKIIVPPQLFVSFLTLLIINSNGVSDVGKKELLRRLKKRTSPPPSAFREGPRVPPPPTPQQIEFALAAAALNELDAASDKLILELLTCPEWCPPISTCLVRLMQRSSTNWLEALKTIQKNATSR